MTLDPPSTIPAEFWAQMTMVEQQELLRVADSMRLVLFPSGSRYISSEVQPDSSDFDLIAFVMVTPVDIEREMLEDHPGWTQTIHLTGRERYTATSIDFTWRRLHLVLFWAEFRFKEFMMATEMARSLDLRDRDQRVKLFRKVCGDEPVVA